MRQTRDWSEEIYEDVQPLPDYQPASPHGLAVLSWRRPLMIALAARVIDAEIVLRVLIEILGGNSIAARRRFACQSEVALEYLVSVATDLDVGSVAVECLIVL